MKTLAISLLALTMSFSDEAAARDAGNRHTVQLPSGASYAPKTARGAAVYRLVRTWAPYSFKTFGTPPAVWARSMEETFAQASLGNLQRATEMETFEGMMGALLGQKVSDDAIIESHLTDLKATDSQPITPASGPVQEASLGSAANDLVYTMVTPCRILDTRNAMGPLRSGQIRDFFVHGTSFAGQGGVDSNCNIPADPSAVAINIVAVYPTADGWLSVFPLGSSTGSSSLNYTQGRVTANEIIAKTTTGQPNDLSVISQYDAHIVIDIVGYFMAPGATELDCYTTAMTGIGVAPNTQVDTGAACQLNYTAVGGLAQWFVGSNYGPIYSGPYEDVFLVSAHNLTGSTQQVYVTAKCCRLPGR